MSYATSMNSSFDFTSRFANPSNSYHITDYAIADFCHPEWLRNREEWLKCRDTVYGGEDQVKDRDYYEQAYIPPTSGQIKKWDDYIAYKTSAGVVQTTIGRASYCSYVYRAQFPNYPEEAVAAKLGMIRSKPDNISLPAGMAYLLEDATPYNEKLSKLIEQIERTQIATSRCGLYADMTQNGRWNLILHEDLKIMNWQTETDPEGNEKVVMLMIDESGYALNGLKWDWQEKYRLCMIDAEGYYFVAFLGGEDIAKLQKTSLDEVLRKKMIIYPLSSGKKMEFIPFEFFNASHNRSQVEAPASLNVVNAALALYRHSADQNQALFMQGQATPVFIGVNEGDDTTLLGALANIRMASPDSQAMMLETSGNGLPEMREKTVELHQYCGEQALKLLQSRDAESAEALSLKIGNKAEGFNGIVSACENGLKRLLRRIAVLGGMNPDEVVVDLNKDFSSQTKNTTKLLQLIQSKNIDAPLTDKDIHNFAVAEGISISTLEEARAEREELHKWQIEKAEKLQNINLKANENKVSVENRTKNVAAD